MPILKVEPQPAHQRIAATVSHLLELGLSLAAIAKRLGGCRKTVAKSIARLEVLKNTR